MKNNIKEIAPLLAEHFIDFDAAEYAYKDYFQLLNENRDKIGVYYNYLDKIHDSKFIKTIISPGKFSITLNDVNTQVCAEVLVNKKNIKNEYKPLLFPLTIDFEITELSFNIVKEDGTIQLIKQGAIEEYLYEEILSVTNDHLKIGLVVWGKKKNRKRGQNILILMVVKNIIVTEHQIEGWSELFGNQFNDFYNYCKSIFNSGTYLGDQSIVYRLYEEFENK